VIGAGRFELRDLVDEAGLRCPHCGSAACVRPLAWRYRKRVTELSTGEVFEQLPILRVRFCRGPTRSVMPADLWRGRCTVGSVLATVVRFLRQGLGPALEWAARAGDGEEPVSERTVRRWHAITRTRLIGSAFAVLGPAVGWSWSQQRPCADELERLLRDLTRPLQLAFRAATEHAVLDRPSVTPPSTPARSRARPVPGRRAEAPPHDPPSILRPRGTWSPRTRRGPPPDG
jgi:hypothetical protein